MACTVVAEVPDERNTVIIRWKRNNRNVIAPKEVSATLDDGMYSINYTYSLTIHDVSLSDADQYSCETRIRSNEIDRVSSSDFVTQNAPIRIKCKYNNRN